MASDNMMSTAEIANALHMSPKTAEVHLTNALRKLRKRKQMHNFTRLVVLTHAAHEAHRKEVECLVSSSS